MTISVTTCSPWAVLVVIPFLSGTRTGIGSMRVIFICFYVGWDELARRAPAHRNAVGNAVYGGPALAARACPTLRILRQCPLPILVNDVVDDFVADAREVCAGDDVVHLPLAGNHLLGARGGEVRAKD